MTLQAEKTVQDHWLTQYRSYNNPCSFLMASFEVVALTRVIAIAEHDKSLWLHNQTFLSQVPQTTMRYRHRSLPEIEEGSEDPYIRLLVLHPGGREGRLTCTLRQTRLSQAGEYEALSYCWGKAPKRKLYINPASVASTAEGRYLLIPASLIPFLYRTRAHPLFKDKARVLWIDSVCINQNDSAEKETQIKYMRDIYMRAEHTIIWLGVGADRSGDALSYIHKLGRKYAFHVDDEMNRVRDPDTEQERAYLAKLDVTVGDPMLEAVFALLEREYFERAWIVQEAVVSPKAHIAVGENSQTWLTFVCALFYLLQVQSWIFEFYPSVQLSLVISLVQTKFHWNCDYDIPWWITLVSHRQARSGLPEDKIFALWGLGCKKQLTDLGVTPNYSQGVEKTYWHLGVCGLESGTAEVLHVPRICIEEEDSQKGIRALEIPSWVPDWRYTEGTAYPLVTSEFGSKPTPSPYRCSSDTTFSPFFQNTDPKTGLPRTLVLEGYTIAQITHITSRSWKIPTYPRHQTLKFQAQVLQSNQHHIQDWESILRLPGSHKRIYDPTGEPYFDAIYKVLSAGLIPKHKEPLANKSFQAFESRQRFLRPILRAGLGSYLWIYIVVVFVERVLRRVIRYRNPEWDFRMLVSPMHNRKGARLKAKVGWGERVDKEVEFLALVPAQSEVGDEMVVCKGVGLPLVLRRKVGGKERRYEFLGDGYVYGAMEGQLWREERCGEVCIE